MDFLSRLVLFPRAPLNRTNQKQHSSYSILFFWFFEILKKAKVLLDHGAKVDMCATTTSDNGQELSVALPLLLACRRDFNLVLLLMKYIDKEEISRQLLFDCMHVAAQGFNARAFSWSVELWMQQFGKLDQECIAQMPKWLHSAIQNGRGETFLRALANYSPQFWPTPRDTIVLANLIAENSDVAKSTANYETLPYLNLKSPFLERPKERLFVFLRCHERKRRKQAFATLCMGLAALHISILELLEVFSFYDCEREAFHALEIESNINRIADDDDDKVASDRCSFVEHCNAYSQIKQGNSI